MTEGDKFALSDWDREILDVRVLPTARRWVQTRPGLAEQGAKTLEYWGEPIPSPNVLSHRA